MIKILDFVAGCTAAELQQRVQAHKSALTAHAKTVGVPAPRESSLVEQIVQSGDTFEVVAVRQYRRDTGEEVILASAEDDLTGLTDKQPPPFSKWDGASGDWVRDVPRAKGDARARINAARETAIAAQVDYGGHTFQADAASIRNVTAVLALTNSGAALPSGFTWRSADNVDVPFTKADVEGLAAAMQAAGWAAYQKCWQLKGEIDALPDTAAQADLDAIKW